MIKEVDWAWLAGIVDGEGTIGAYYQGKKRGRRCVTPVLQVVSTDEIIVLETAHIVRSLGIQRDPFITGKTKAGKDIWVWSCRSPKEICQILPRLIPYLRLKKLQAELLQEICDNGPYWRGTPAWVRDNADQIRAMNQRANAERDRKGAVRGTARTPGPAGQRHGLAPAG